MRSVLADPARAVAMVAVAALHLLAVAALLANRPPSAARNLAPAVEAFLLFAPEAVQPAEAAPLGVADRLTLDWPRQPMVEADVTVAEVAVVPEPTTGIAARIEATPSPDPAVALSATPPALATPAIREIEAVDYLVSPQPSYPAASRRLREQGTVWLRVLVGEDGRARNAQVIRSSGSVRLDSAACEAVMAARFRPYTENDQPRAAYVRVPIEFALRRS